MTDDRSRSTAPLHPDDARAALDEVHRRQDQTRAAATAPWPARTVLPVVATFPVLGYLLDVDLVWAFAAGVVVLVVVLGGQAVRLRRTERDGRRTAALVAAGVLALLLDVLVQLVVRGADLGLPNTWGAVGAGVVVLGVLWPLQRRTGPGRAR